MTIQVTSNTVFDKPFKFLNMHSKFATGVLPFTPNNNPYPGGVLEIDEGSSGGVGPELDKGYKAIQWNSPLDASGNQIATELKSYPDNVKTLFKQELRLRMDFRLRIATTLFPIACPIRI